MRMGAQANRGADLHHIFSALPFKLYLCFTAASQLDRTLASIDRKSVV